MSDEPTTGLPVHRGPGTAAGWAPHPPPTGSAREPGAAEGARDGHDPRPGPPPGPDAPAASPPGPAGGRNAAPRRRRWPVVLLVVALLAALGAAGYLYATTTAYAERLAWTERQARAIGTELVTTRGELEGVRGELGSVRAQLATAQERITALADEKARIGDDREAQAQLLDYQARVSAAAGLVASALERCVQGQDQLIAYLGDAESYDPAELEQFGQDVERLCRSASEANLALQTELADR